MNDRVYTAATNCSNDLTAHIDQIQVQLERMREALTLKEPASVGIQVTPARIRRLIRARSLRGSFFSDGLFSDPAWDMLLEAFAVELEQHRVSVSGLCHASGAPHSTALRWLVVLEEAGWLVRDRDPLDRRRQWVRLSSKGLDAMHRYMGAAAIGGLLV